MQVGAFGFPEQQRSKIEKIVKLSRKHQYQLVTFDGEHWPELILVFGEQALSQPPLDQLPNHLHERVVIVSRNRPELTQYLHVGYPLISSRVVRTLDQLADKPLESESVDASADAVTATAVSEPNSEVMSEAKDTPDTQVTEAPDAAESNLAVSEPVQVSESFETPVETPVDTAVEALVDAVSEVASDDTSTVAEPALPVTETPPVEAPEALETNTSTPETSETPETAAASDDSASDAVAEQDEPSGNELTVLVVDDSAPMRKALANELEGLPIDMSIEFAENGELALEMASGGNYDLIFLDIMMPGIDGFETCTELRKMAHVKKTPIIMLSSKTSPLDEVKGIMAGCSTYLTKPIVPEEFKKVMLRVTKWITEYRPERMAAMAKLRTSVSS
jgi:CheY-like chemotaxis protein